MWWSSHSDTVAGPSVVVCSTSCADWRRPKTLGADGGCAGVHARLTMARESAASRRGVWRWQHQTRYSIASWRMPGPWPPPVVRRDRLAPLCHTRAAPGTVRAVLSREPGGEPQARRGLARPARTRDARVSLTLTWR